MKKKITIIDYGVGNILSITRAIEKCGEKSCVSKNSAEILSSTHIILPGVGAFFPAMEKIKKNNLVNLIQDISKKNIPLLGICLGMQLLMETSEEFGLHKGISLIKGNVIHVPKFSKKKILKVPYVGWFPLILKNNKKNDILLKKINSTARFYFVHSYMIEPKNSNIVAFYNNEGNKIPAIIRKNNVYGCQFHPEKSGVNGLKLLKNFINLN
jgi:glutamine amidotransferase